MAKIGYIFMANNHDDIESDKMWMKDFGCCDIIEERPEDEKGRPMWTHLMTSLGRGDEIVISRFSNACRGTRELAFFLELCRIQVVRVVSIHDKIDSSQILFPETRISDVLFMFGSIPAEITAMRKASDHVMRLKRKIKPSTAKAANKQIREQNIVNMYQAGLSIDDIWKASGFKSRSSVFRILNKYNISLNRGKFSGPIKKRKNVEE